MTTPFRIGGVYRDHDGTPVVLSLTPVCSGAVCGVGEAFKNGVNGEGRGICRLNDGRSPWGGGDHLLPGELTRRNGEWVPIDSPSPIQYLEDDSGLVCGEPVWVDVDFGREEGEEPKRPRLTWADPKPADRWDGYRVVYERTLTGGKIDENGVYTLIVQSDRVAPLHPLQLSPDAPQAFEPGRFGSAYLLKTI